MKQRIALAMLMVLALGAVARADFGPILVGGSGTGGGGLPVSGTATFSLTGSTLTIVLNNTSSVAAIGALLTGVGWSFVGGSGLSISDPTTAQTAGYTCSGSGAGTVCIDGTSGNGWKQDQVTLGGMPFDITILGGGPPRVGALANDSIKTVGKDGLSNDQPYLKSPVTFTLTVSGNIAGITGINANDVFFQFGTTVGEGFHAPEPGFYGTLALALSGLGYFVHRRRRQA